MTTSPRRLVGIVVATAVSVLAVLPGLAVGTPHLSERGTSISDRIAQSLALAEQRAPLPDLLNLANLDDDLWNRHFHCYASYADTRVPICPLGDTAARKTVVAFGDSHVGQWLVTLDRLGKQRGFKVIPLIKLSCAPYDVKQAIVEVGGEFTQCTAFRRWARGKIAAWRPAVVVLGARVLAGGSLDATISERAADWRRGVGTGVRRLLRLGVGRVKALADLVEVEKQPGPCLRREGATMASCLSTPGRRVTVGNRVVRNAAEAAGAAYVDVLPLVCRNDLCPAVVGRVVTFRDDDHISNTWARAVVRAFGRRLGVR